MKFDKLNIWLTLLANFSVVAGIIVLVIEINKNTQAIQLSSYQDLTGRIVEYNQLEIQNPDLKHVSYIMGLGNPACLRGDKSDVKLNEEETYLFNSIIFIWLRHADMAFFQYSTGAIDKERLLSAIAPLLNLLNIQRFIDRWKFIKVNFVPEFQAFMDEQIVEIESQCKNST